MWQAGQGGAHEGLWPRAVQGAGLTTLPGRDRCGAQAAPHSRLVKGPVAEGPDSTSTVVSMRPALQMVAVSVPAAAAPAVHLQSGRDSQGGERCAVGPGRPKQASAGVASSRQCPPGRFA